PVPSPSPRATSSSTTAALSSLKPRSRSIKVFCQKTEGCW
ncbi:unnamed protein product, partial [Musa banksii]